MIAVRIFKDNAKEFANLVDAVNFEACKTRVSEFSERHK